ncbi:MAG: hypothetical protein JNL94_11050, partial [Planctomycetes bacterium]|nr:hypothetical protein [Planctomycetota bacterium]
MLVRALIATTSALALALFVLHDALTHDALPAASAGAAAALIGGLLGAWHLLRRGVPAASLLAAATWIVLAATTAVAAALSVP